MSLLEKAIIILLSSPTITLFACHLGTQLRIAFLAARQAALLNPGFLSSSRVRQHTLARETPQVSSHSNSQNSVSSGHYSFKLTLGHPPCVLCIQSKRNHLHTTKHQTLELPISLQMLYLSLSAMSFLISQDCQQAHKCFLSSRSSTLSIQEAVLELLPNPWSW